jgi:hypothetical protein
LNSMGEHFNVAMQRFVAGSKYSLSNIPYVSIQSNQISTAETSIFHLFGSWRLS